MKDCLRDIHASGVGYKRAQVYGIVEFDTTEALYDQ